MQGKKFNIAILGATGLVGQAFIQILFERKFPIHQLYLLASEKSAGKTIALPNGDNAAVSSAEKFDWSNADIALFSAGGDAAKYYAPIAEKAGCITIDNSSAFRLDKNIPLIIPEVNGETLKNYTGKIIANPNCSTIQLLMALYPIYIKYGLKKIIISTYQAASGAGTELINQLEQGDGELVNNVIPQIDQFCENAYSREEMKMVWETHKIFNNTNIKISATAVRVPVFNGHSEAVTIETVDPITPEDVIKLYQSLSAQSSSGLSYQEQWMTPKQTSGQDKVYISRVREALVFDHGLSLWIVADNIRKGAALNAVQIAECLIDRLN